MINEELYFKTREALFDAFERDAIVHRSSSNSALGVIAGASLGYFISPNGYWLNGEEIVQPRWSHVVHTGPEGDLYINVNSSQGDLRTSALEQLSWTGYNIGEMSRIEWAFEGVNQEDRDGFVGLIGVLKQLSRIHHMSPVEENREIIELITIKQNKDGGSKDN